MTSENIIRRRPTRQIERVLDLAETNYHSLMVSRRYADSSRRRNSAKQLQNLREIEIASWTVVATLKWVLGIGLSSVERDRTLKEIESGFDAEPN